MLRNARVTAFTVFELLTENQPEEVKLPPLSLPQPRLGLKQRRKTLFILNQYKTQNMCEKEMKSDQDCYEILEMYKKADDKYPYAWIFP